MNRHTTVAGSVLNSFKGIPHALKGRNFKIQVFIALIVMALAETLSIPPTQQLILMVTILAVFAAEFFNTAIEELSDVVTLEHHPGIARVKELSAGAVLLVCIAAVTVVLYIFLPYLHF